MKYTLIAILMSLRQTADCLSPGLRSRRHFILAPPVVFLAAPVVAAEAKDLVIDEVRLGQGDGPPALGQTVSIDYTLWLDGFDGKKQISKVTKPVYIELGQELMPKGIEQALLSMRVGGVRRLIVPPDLAYGSSGYPREGEKKGSVIPPNSNIYVEVRLRTIKTQVALFGLGIY